MVPSVPKNPWVVIALLSGFTLLAYHDVGSAGFVWDDFDNIVHNDELRDLEGLGRIWTEPSSGIQFFPVWNTLLWLLYRIDGANPAVFTIAGACLHAVTVGLLYLVCRRTLREPSFAVPEDRANLVAFLAAFLFAIHPVQVESIAWSTELKNTTSVPLLLAAWLVFLGRSPRAAAIDTPPAVERTTGKRWVATLVLTVLAVLAKPTTAVIVPVFMGLEWARGSRLPAAIARYLPHLILAAAFAVFTALHEREALGARGEAFERPLLERVALVGHVFWFHVRQVLGLEEAMFFHPRFAVEPESFASWSPLLALALVFAAAAVLSRTGRKVPLGGLTAYLLFLLPTSGLFPFYFHRYGDVQDHFAYLPLVPLCALLGWLVASGSRLAVREERCAAALALVLVGTHGAFLLPRTWERISVFANEEALWRDSIRKNDAAFAAHLNLAHLLAERGELEEALGHARRSVALEGNLVESRRTLGLLLVRAGAIEAALPHLDRALELDPTSFEARFTRGIAAQATGRHTLAIEDFAWALEARPEDANVHAAKGKSHLERSEADLAAWHLERAIRLQPGDLEAWFLLGRANELLREPEEARRAWNRALTLAERTGNGLAAEEVRRALARLPR